STGLRTSPSGAASGASPAEGQSTEPPGDGAAACRSAGLAGRMAACCSAGFPLPGRDISEILSTSPSSPAAAATARIQRFVAQDLLIAARGQWSCNSTGGATGNSALAPCLAPKCR